MKYVALLRGINVGGNNKVAMPQLKALCESLGFEQVTTYINSGNVLFSTPTSDRQQLGERIEAAIAQAFGFKVNVLVVEDSTIFKVATSTPKDWVNDSEVMKCDVLFLWPDMDRPSIIEDILHTDGIDELLYYPNAVVWKVLRKNYTRSGMNKLIGTEVYKKSTVRNINTVRKLAQLLQSME